jgi:hypothetical protein
MTLTRLTLCSLLTCLFACSTEQGSDSAPIVGQGASGGASGSFAGVGSSGGTLAGSGGTFAGNGGTGGIAGMQSAMQAGTGGTSMSSDAGTMMQNTDASDDMQHGDAAVVDASGSDSIYGTSVPRAEAWWVAGDRIYYGAEERRLFGFNWFGLEGDARALFGPTESGRSVSDFLAQISDLGFNALRVPLAPESIRPGFATADWAKRGTIDTGREGLDELIEAARPKASLCCWTCTRARAQSATSPRHRSTLRAAATANKRGTTICARSRSSPRRMHRT